MQHFNILPFNGLFSMTAFINQYQKGKTILDFTEARDDGVAMASAEPYAKHLHSIQTDNHANISPSNFYRLDALPAAPPTVSKHRRPFINAVL